jgi:hypothetical protein
MAAASSVRAIQKSLKTTPRNLRNTCTRRSPTPSSALQLTGTPRPLTGRVRVWYRVRDGKLAWFYTLTARRSQMATRRAPRDSGSASRFGAERAIRARCNCAQL